MFVQSRHPGLSSVLTHDIWMIVAVNLDKNINILSLTLSLTTMNGLIRPHKWSRHDILRAATFRLINMAMQFYL